MRIFLVIACVAAYVAGIALAGCWHTPPGRPLCTLEEVGSYQCVNHSDYDDLLLYSQCMGFSLSRDAYGYAWLPVPCAIDAGSGRCPGSTQTCISKNGSEFCLCT